MGKRVRILPEQLANKIAAGEVVERPASVVKELVENALDAGAGEVIVEIEEGGRRLIKVTDDGCGMSREDALLALERHATSKITVDADLFALQSLGFRGEALPSVASVSRLSLCTREESAIEGVEIYAEGGTVREVKSCGMATGTAISVRNLFFNTPARLKFMKGRETESGHIGETLHRLALSRPDTRFIYNQDGRNVYRLPAGSLPVRAAAVLGNSLAQHLYPIDYSAGPLRLHGLAGSPAASRSTAAGIYTFLNGRFIRDRVIQHAIMQAYRNVLERGRYPVVVLFLDLPAGDVDVNVHPTKHEVRFREQQAVHGAVQSALDELLRGAPWQKPVQPLLQAPAPVTRPGVAATRVEEVRDALLRYALREPAPAQPPAQSFPAPVTAPRPDAPDEPVEPVEPAQAAAAMVENAGLALLRIIGQFRSAYIIAEDGEELVIIDQHAAHERILFEELRSGFLAEGCESQSMLFTETVELSPAESAALQENLATVRRLGFDLEAFGGTTWLLSGVPRLLAGQSCQQLLRDILEELASFGSSGLVAEKCDELLTRIACHSAVRGTWRQTPEEMRTLLQRMDRTDFSANCPHGRPAIVRIGLREIEKMFRRT